MVYYFLSNLARNDKLGSKRVLDFLLLSHRIIFIISCEEGKIYVFVKFLKESNTHIT